MHSLFGGDCFCQPDELIGKSAGVVNELFFKEFSLGIKFYIHAGNDKHIGTRNSKPSANLILHSYSCAYAPHSTFRRGDNTESLFGLFWKMVEQIAYRR